MSNARIFVKKQGNESSSSLLKRFTRKVSSSGVLRDARSNRFASRNVSDLKKKQGALRRIEKFEEKKMQAKLGKIFKRGRRR